jgi:hypothetical protein
MPIDGFSNLVRLDRLGRIRLGIRVQNPRTPDDPTQTIPRAVDYLVCPPEVQQVYGEKPTSIYPIMFPSNNDLEWLSQYYRCYGLTYGLTCFGDGITAKQKVDTDTGAMADRNTVEGHWVWKEELTCNPERCEQFLKKRCRPIMRLQFMLPEVHGLGVYEVATTSYHSRMNIQSQIAMVRDMAERVTGKRQIAMIPFTLAMGPQEVNPPGQKRKTVWILHLKNEAKLGDLLRIIANPLAQFLLTTPVAQTAEEAAKEELPGDLLGSFGDEEEPGEDEASEQGKKTTTTKKSRKPDDGKKQLTAGGAASTTEHPPGPAATALEEAAKKQAGQVVGAPLLEIDLFMMAKELLGDGSWELFVLPKMMQLFGHTEYKQMDLTQTILLKHSITGEAERRAMEKKNQQPPSPGGLLPRGGQVEKKQKGTSVEEELRKDITASLKAITQNREEALQWLQEHFQVKTLAGMSVDQLKKVKEAIAAKKTGDDVPF